MRAAALVVLVALAALVAGQQFANKIPDDVARDLLANLDTSVSPCDDFYQYACGGWMNRTKLPSYLGRYDRSFNGIEENNRKLLEKLLESTKDDKLQKFYRACKDTDTINSRGAAPLKPLLAKIDAVTSTDSLFDLVGELVTYGVNAFLAFGVQGDAKGSVPLVNTGDLTQGGLGLSVRDYYLATDPASLNLLKQYQQHIANLFVLLGSSADQAAATAALVVDFETTLAKNQISSVDLRDPQKTYNMIGFTGLQKVSPLPWKRFMQAISFPADKAAQLNVEVPAYFTALAQILRTTPLSTVKAYLKWQVTHTLAPTLSSAFVAEDFNFFKRILLGSTDMPTRTKTCVDATDAALGYLLGQYYVQEVFSGESKEDVEGLIADIEQSFLEILPNVDWMDDDTRKQAKSKLNAIVNNVGFPANWPAYDGYNVSAGRYAENVLLGTRFQFLQQVKKVGKAVDKHEWQMTPPTVNAYYDPLTNTINFPAGILQAPFFDVTYPAPMNFGGIGMVMGHELTHGFDDQGAQYDGNGRLVQWWSDEVVKRFQTRTQCIASQYSKFQPVPGVFVNGNLTLGENIADNGGIKETLNAYRAWAKKQPTPPPDYMTPHWNNEQLLFVSFAQTWCEIATPDFLRHQVSTNPHSPAKFRVNGPLSNFKDFATAFSCPASSPMNPDSKCLVW